MKNHASALVRSVIMLGLILVLGTLGVGQARADGPTPQPTPDGITTITTVSPPPPGITPVLGAGWYDGLIQWSSILNCPSIIFGNPYYESGAGTYVGYYANPGASQPAAGSVYYVHVIIEAVGNACSGQYGYVDIGLPANTSLAISVSNPVYCFANGVSDPADCPQVLPASPYNSGFYDIQAPASSSYLWPMPIGKPWEFQIPVVSSTTLSGSNFQAAVHVLDGNSSPWLNPTEGIYVFTPPTPPPGAFSKSTPANLAINQSNAPTLLWTASSGATGYEYCIDSINNNLCDTSWISTGTATSTALTGLAHGRHYYWQVRSHNSVGYTYANGSSAAFWTFTTLPRPGAINKTAPPNGAVNQSTGAILKWTASSNAASYQYCIDTTNNNTCNTAWVSTGTIRYKVLSGLIHGKTYYWQVRAKNLAGYTYANGAVTAWWSFTVR